MKIPVERLSIPEDKLTRYLLVSRDENDKSRWLAQAGFTIDNPDRLKDAIVQMVERFDAIKDRENEYGEFYRIVGNLVGANGVVLEAVSIWILLREDSDTYQFITLKPEK